VFEFGMGGSSLFFLDRGCVLTSVEHDAAWHQSVRERIPAKANWRDLIRPPTPWPERGERQPCYGSGFPGCEHQCFRDYLAPLEAARENSFNLILVDGRARAGALEAAESKVVPGGWLILDNAERTRYAEAQEHLKRKGWRLRRFSGPGPYVQHEFWDTNIWIRPLT
jgi:hypothetical protein